MSFSRPENAPPRVLGHRGARRRATENTLESFDLALEEGAAGIELDVRLAADQEVVVFHDPSLARLFHGDGREVEKLSRADIRRLGIPRLTEVLDWASDNDALLNIELKRDLRDRKSLVREVAVLVQRFRFAEDRVLLSSFDPLFVRALSHLAPKIPTCWLVHQKQRVFRHALGWKLLGAQGVNPEAALATDARVSRWKRRGALINVWTVNDPAEARRLARAGVDTLISDVPGEIVRALSG